MLDKIILEEKKKMIYEYMTSKEYKPVKIKEMAGILQVPRREKADFHEVIDSLISDGKIMIDNRGLLKASSDQLKAGTFSGTAKGFGFVMIEGEKEDIFIPEMQQKVL